MRFDRIFYFAILSIFFLTLIVSCAKKNEITYQNKKGIIEIDNGLCYIPKSYNIKQEYALILILHGSCEKPHKILSNKFFQDEAENRNYIICALKSDSKSWTLKKDKIDCINIKKMIKHMKSEYNIRKDKICLYGFSDGGSYTFRVIFNGEKDKSLKYLFNAFIVFSGDGYKIEKEIKLNQLDISNKIPGYISWGKGESNEPGKSAAISLSDNNWDITTKIHKHGHTLTREATNNSFNWLDTKIPQVTANLPAF